MAISQNNLLLPEGITPDDMKIYFGQQPSDGPPPLPDGFTPDDLRSYFADEPSEKQGKGLFGKIKDTGLATVDALGSSVLNVPAKALMVLQGQSGASVADRGWADNYIKWVEDRNRKLAEQHSGDFIPGLISNKDVVEAGGNLAFSGVSGLGTVYGGIVGAPAGPVGAVGGALAGGAAAAYRMNGYQVMQGWLEKKNQESIDKGLGPISKEQEDKFKEELSELATKHSLWEAGPEAVGNVLEIALLAAKNIPGVRWMPEKLVGKAVKGVLRTMGVLGTELTTEGITQTGQTNTEIEAGMSTETPRDWTSIDDQMKSLKEVLPQVLLLTGFMSGGGMAYRKATGKDKEPFQKDTSKIDVSGQLFEKAKGELHQAFLGGKLNEDQFDQFISQAAPQHRAELKDLKNQAIADKVRIGLEQKLGAEMERAYIQSESDAIREEAPIAGLLELPSDWQRGRGPEGPMQFGPARGEGYSLRQTRETTKDAGGRWVVDIEDEELKAGLESQIAALEAGEGPSRFPVGEGLDQRWTGQKSGNPEWFQSQGITKEKAVEALRKAQDGKPLGVAEARIVEGALKDLREQSDEFFYREAANDKTFAAGEAEQAKADGKREADAEMERAYVEAERQAIQEESGKEVDTKEFIGWWEIIKRGESVPADVLERMPGLKDLKDEYNAWANADKEVAGKPKQEPAEPTPVAEEKKADEVVAPIISSKEEHLNKIPKGERSKAYFSGEIDDLIDKEPEEVHKAYREIHPEGPAVLYKPETDRGVMITQSSKEPGKFQLTYFDKMGFSMDTQHDTEQAAMGNAYEAGYTIPDPGRAEKQFTEDRFIEGNKKSDEVRKFNEAQAKKSQAEPVQEKRKREISDAQQKAEDVAKAEDPDFEGYDPVAFQKGFDLKDNVAGTDSHKYTPGSMPYDSYWAGKNAKKADLAKPEAKAPDVGEKATDEIFIRPLTKAEQKSNAKFRDGYNTIPEKEGYEAVYKPYGTEGKGYYYVKKVKQTKEEMEAAIDKFFAEDEPAKTINYKKIADELFSAALKKGWKEGGFDTPRVDQKTIDRIAKKHRTSRFDLLTDLSPYVTVREMNVPGSSEKLYWLTRKEPTIKQEIPQTKDEKKIARLEAGIAAGKWTGTDLKMQQARIEKLKGKMVDELKAAAKKDEKASQPKSEPAKLGEKDVDINRKPSIIEDSDAQSIREQLGLFGDIVRPETRTTTNRSTKPRSRKNLFGPESDQGNLFDQGIETQGKEQPIYDTTDTQKPIELTPAKGTVPGALPGAGRVQYRKSGQLTAASDAVHGTSDLASLLARIRTEPDEYFYAVAVDKNGKVLEIHEHTKGGRSASTVFPDTVVGRILQLPGIAKAYFAHNHPTGDSTPSPQDIATTKDIDRLLSIAKIPTESIIFGGNEFSVIGEGRPVTKKIKPSIRKTIISKVRRRTGKTPNIQTPSLAGPADVFDFFRDSLNNEDGVLFVNQKNHPIAFLPFVKGRTMRDTTKDILITAERINASNIIIKNDKAISTRARYSAALKSEGLGSIKVLDILENGRSIINGDLESQYAPVSPGARDLTLGSETKLSMADTPAVFKTDDAKKAWDLVEKAEQYKPEEGETPIKYPIFFHSGTGDISKVQAEGIQPMFGDWVSEVLSGATDDEINVEESFIPLSYYSDIPNWVRMQVGRKVKKSYDQVTKDDIRKHGYLAVVYNVDEQNGETVYPNIYRMVGDYNGAQTDVENAYGEEQQLYETDLYEENWSGNKEPFGMESGDFVTTEAIDPDVLLTGDALIEFMDRYKQKSPDIRYSMSIYTNQQPKGDFYNGLLQSERDALESIRRDPELRNLYEFLERGIQRPIRPGTLRTVQPTIQEQKVVARIARGFGNKAVFWETDDDLRVDGLYNPDDSNTVYLNTASTKPLLSLVGHELLHSLKANRPDLYNFLVNATKNNIVDFDGFLDKLGLKRGMGISEELGHEELYADFLGDQFGQEEFWNKLYAADKTMAQKLLHAIRKIIARVMSYSQPSTQGHFKNVKDVQDVLVKVMKDFRTGKVVSDVGVNQFAQPVRMSLAKAVKSILDNPNFRKWFGNSVLTVDGKVGSGPLVLYHGTESNFDEFDPKMVGSKTGMIDTQVGDAFFFTDDADFAGDMAIAGIKNQSVMPVYVSMKNPHINELAKATPGAIAKEIKYAKENGHDGVALSFTSSKVMKSTGNFFIAFSPTQIKSVYNQGTFDATNPDIRLQIAHHGTPHIWAPEPGFPNGRPRLDKIGTGEGGAAYGHGIYFGEKSELASGYMGSANDDVFKPALDFVISKKSEYGMAKSDINSYIRSLIGKFTKQDTLTIIKSDFDIESVKNGFEDLIKTVKEEAIKEPEYAKTVKLLEDFYGSMPNPSLYKLDIPDSVIPKLLDWDKPLSEQTEYVKKALEKAGFSIKDPIVEQRHGRWAIRDSDGVLQGPYFIEKAEAEDRLGAFEKTGEKLYSDIVDKHMKSGMGRGSAMEAASMDLRDLAGIPGNVHGGVSKGATGLKYVIWDQAVLDKIALLARNQEPLKAMQETRLSVAGEKEHPKVRQLKKTITDLKPMVDAAYESGAKNAETLDAELETAYSDLEDILAEIAETESNNDTEQLGVEADLANAYGGLFAGGKTAVSYGADTMTRKEKADLLRSIAEDHGWQHGGFNENVTDEQIISAAKDAYESSKSPTMLSMAESMNAQAQPFTGSAPTGTSKIQAYLEKNNMGEKWEKVASYLWDQDAAIKRVQAELPPQPETRDYALLKGLMGKKIADEIKLFDRDRLQPLLKDMADSKVKIADIQELLHADHAPERNLQMKRVNARRYIDSTLSQMTDAEAQPFRDRIIEISEDFMMNSLMNNDSSINDRRDDYVSLMDELSTVAPDFEKRLEAKQKEFDDRVFSEKEIDKGTPELLQKRLDNARDRLERLSQVTSQWSSVKDRLSGMTNERSEEVKQKWANNPNINRIADTLRQINSDSLEILHESGEVSDEEYNAMHSAYALHVPLMREGYMEGKASTGQQGYGPLAKPLKIAYGSTKGVKNIFATIIDRYQSSVTRKHKLESGKALYNMVKENSDEDRWTITKLPKTPRYDSEGNIQMYDDHGDPGLDAVYVKVNGDKYLIQVPHDNKPMMRFMAAVKKTPTVLGPVTQASRKIVQVLAALNTSFSPEFLVTNFMRDLPVAMVHLETIGGVEGAQKTVLKNVKSAIKGIYQAERGDESSDMAKLYREFSKHGGAIGWMQSYDTTEKLAKHIERELAYAEGRYPNKAKLRKLGKWVNNMNTAVENGVRLAAYKVMIEHGLTKNKAARAASGLTIDFTQHGTAGPMINSFYMFANAGIQGNVRMITAVATNRKVQKIAAGIVGFGALANIMGAMLGGDDDDGEAYYDKLKRTSPSLFERNMIFMIPGSKGRYFKIPMPYGYNTFFVLGNEVAGTIRGKSPVDGMANIGNALIGTLNPLASATWVQTLAPTLMDPFVQVAENKTWAGSKLMPDENPFGVPVPDSERYFRSVNPVAKYVAKSMNWITGGDKFKPGFVSISPETIEMAFETFTGSAGKMIKDSLSIPLAAMSEEGLSLNKVPFARKLISAQSPYVDDAIYRENSLEVDTLVKRWKESDVEDRTKLREEEPLTRMMQYSKGVHSVLLKLNKILKAAEKADNAERTKRIKERIQEVKRAYNKKYNDVKNL